MKGVIVNDFELAIKKLNSGVDGINARVNEINRDFNDLSKSLAVNDLKFLTSKLGLEINLMSNVKNKHNGYQNVLTNVLKSYQYELDELTRNIGSQQQ